MSCGSESFLSNKCLRRIITLGVFLWAVSWIYVGWRGFSLIDDAKQFISLQPPGGVIPPGILSALEIGQSYVLRAISFGMGAPIALLVGYWIYRGFRRTNDS